MDYSPPTPTRSSHEAAVIERLRADPQFAAEYPRAATEDTDEPAVLQIALRRIAEARRADP